MVDCFEVFPSWEGVELSKLGDWKVEEKCCVHQVNQHPNDTCIFKPKLLLERNYLEVGLRPVTLARNKVIGKGG